MMLAAKSGTEKNSIRRPDRMPTGAPAGARRRPRLAPPCDHPDFSLIRAVQTRATGANIHALSQQLQIYVSAIECGAISCAQAMESQLRAFLAV